MKEEAILCYFNTLNEEGSFDFLRPVVCRDVKDILALYRGDTPVAVSAAEGLEKMLLERLKVLYVGILISRLNQLVRKYDFSQAISPSENITDELRKAARDLNGELNIREGWLEGGSMMKWAAKRAPKAAGIGLCALEAQKVLKLPEHRQVTREVLDLALDSLLRENQLYWNDSLLRGNALSVLFLERAGRYLQRPELQDRAGKMLISMEKRSETYGYFHLMEKGVRNCFDISFLEGSLGIGFAAIEARKVCSGESTLSAI